eukprot:3244245-Amphidinium_carterae.1
MVIYKVVNAERTGDLCSALFITTCVFEPRIHQKVNLMANSSRISSLRCFGALTQLLAAVWAQGVPNQTI